jgi:hypothetical protein
VARKAHGGQTLFEKMSLISPPCSRAFCAKGNNQNDCVALFQLTARINRKGGTMREIIGAAALTLAITPAFSC